MDAAELARRARAARTRAEQIDGRRFDMLCPTRHELSVETLRHAGAGVGAGYLLAQRALLERALTGWSGVTLRDLDPALEPDDVEHSAALVPLLLDAQPDWAEQLGAALMQATLARAARIEDARGN